MTDRERPLRLVCFSLSIIADITNPAATSTRALLGALAATGHDVTHMERRGNPLLDRQLRVRGSAALRALNTRYPAIRVRQYDLPRGQQRTVWFGTEVSTADAVVALPGTSEEILALIAPFETPHLVRIVPPGSVGDASLPGDRPLVCVERRSRLDSGPYRLAVAYDNVDTLTTRDVPPEFERIVIGDSDLPEWRALPEVEVAELYRSAQRVVVFDRDERPEAMARAMLPVAAGCEVVHVVSGDDGRTRQAPAPLPERNDAAVVAEALVALVRGTLALKRRGFEAGLPGRAGQ